MPDDWLDKASGKWVTGPEVAASGTLTAKIDRLGEETMTGGDVRPVLYVKIAGRERIVAVNKTASDVLRAYLKGKQSGALIGKTVTLTTEIARNPRTGVVGPAVRIKEVRA